MFLCALLIVFLAGSAREYTFYCPSTVPFGVAQKIEGSMTHVIVISYFIVDGKMVQVSKVHIHFQLWL